MIAKNGDKVVVTKNGVTGGVHYRIGDRGVMTEKAEEESTGGFVTTDSGKVIYLFQNEYSVVVGEDVSEVITTAVTAESLRNRFYEIEKEEEAISKKIDALCEEKSKIEDDLRAMGFMLCSSVKEDFMTIVDDTPEIDYNDWRNWKKGDMVECVNDEGWGNTFVSGGLYKVLGIKDKTLYIETEQRAMQPITSTVVDFRFHSPF